MNKCTATVDMHRDGVRKRAKHNEEMVKCPGYMAAHGRRENITESKSFSQTVSVRHSNAIALRSVFSLSLVRSFSRFTYTRYVLFTMDCDYDHHILELFGWCQPNHGSWNLHQNLLNGVSHRIVSALYTTAHNRYMRIKWKKGNLHFMACQEAVPEYVCVWL